MLLFFVFIPSPVSCSKQEQKIQAYLGVDLEVGTSPIGQKHAKHKPVFVSETSSQSPTQSSSTQTPHNISLKQRILNAKTNSPDDYYDTGCNNYLCGYCPGNIFHFCYN